MTDMNLFVDEILKIKRARLVEHNMSYEDLLQENHFSEDEATFEYTLERLK
jgi:hypothetical protein